MVGCWVLGLMVCAVVVAGEPAIVAAPQNTTVRVRGTATLSCAVTEKGLYEVNWVWRDGSVISTDYEVASSAVDTARYSIVGEAARGEYSLRIARVLRLDAGSFRCQLRDRASGSSVAVSAPAQLVVQYAPGQSYPLCQPDFRGAVGLPAGRRVDFACSTEPGNPPARLEWSGPDGRPVPGAELDDNTAGSLRLEFSRNVTAEDNGRAFVCRLSHELLPEPTTCQVGPLDVTFPPMDVTIVTTARPHVGHLHLMTCQAAANPLDGLVYKWYTLPSPASKGLAQRLINNSNVVFLNPVEPEDDGTVFVCEARTELGAANASLTLDVLKPSPTPQPTTTIAATTTVAPDRPSPRATGASPVDGAETAPYVIILILIAVALLLLALALVIIALKRKKQPSQAVISVRDLDNLHADVHSLASFGNLSRHGTPYLDRVDYELGRSRSHSRDTFDNVSLDSASALVSYRSHSQSSPTHRKYSVDSLGKPLARSSPHDSHRNGSPTHGATAGGKRLDSYPDKGERKLSESALSQAGRPLPKISGPVQQNEYAELTPVSARKKYASQSATSPESGFADDDYPVKPPLNDAFPPPSSNNCNCSGRKVSHVEV